MLDRADRRPLCRVKSCINGNSETRNYSERVFHFPRGKGPTRNAAIEWLRFVNEFEELDRFITTGHYSSKFRSYSICQRHFAPHQFVTPDRTRLNRGAVPLYHNPDDVSATDLLPPWCQNETHSTTESHDEITSSGACNSDGTGRENQIRLLKEEIKALIEVDNSQLNLSSQDTVDVIHVVDDTLLDSEYLYVSSEANVHASDNEKAAERTTEEIDMVVDGQEVNKRVKPDSFVSEDLIHNIETHPVASVHDEPDRVKNYSKIKGENISLLSEYVENRSEFPYENKQETSESELLPVKWEVLPEEMCRLCASRDEHLKQPINTWMKMMQQLIPNTVGVNDGLPQYICRTCAEKLVMCITIKQDFIASYRKLKSEFTANKENVETGPELITDYPDCDNPVTYDSEDENNDLTLCNSLDSSAFSKNAEFVDVTTNNKGRRIKKKVKKYSFICMECEKLFFSSKALKDHMKTEHDTVKCEYCNRSFTDSSELQEHVRTHTTETQFKCQCGTQVKSIKHLKAHIINHKPPRYNCSTCCKSFRNFFEMKHHEKGHKKSICDVCGKQMKNDAYLRVHLRMHTGEKPYQCELCGVSFSTSDRYYIHRYKKHSNERFHCDICGKILYTEYSFERHKLGHEKGKQFVCEVCLLDFRYKFSKDLHQRKKCSSCFCVVCSLVFSDIKELVEHRSKEHLEEEITTAALAYRSQRTYNCNVCPKSFKKSESLTNHIRRCHKKTKKPSLEFSPRKKSVQKKPRKVFSCSKCEKKFKSHKALKLHSASYHEDENCNFSCSYCKEQFEELNALIAHESQHLKEKVFSCCGWIFCSKADYIRHKRLHSQNISGIPFEDENYSEETTELNIVLPSHMLT